MRAQDSVFKNISNQLKKRIKADKPQHKIQSNNSNNNKQIKIKIKETNIITKNQNKVSPSKQTFPLHQQTSKQMGCCGSTQKVRKVVIPPQRKQVQETKVEVREDDVIQIPKDQRRLFRVEFDLKTVLPPEYAVIRSVDYSTVCTEIEVLGQLVREEARAEQQQRERQQQQLKPLQRQTEGTIKEPSVNTTLNQSALTKPEENNGLIRLKRIAQQEVDLQVIDEQYSPRRRGKQQREEVVMIS